MSASAATIATSTVVRNGLSVGRFFSFVGQNGAYLAAGADVAVPGSLFDLWAKDTVQMSALKAAIASGSLIVMETPAVIVYDATATATKQLGADNSLARATNPTYGSYSGSAPAP